MAGIKQRGPQSVNNKRYYKGQEVRPTMYVFPGGRKLLTGTVIETDQIVTDENGRPVPWQSIN